MYNKNSSMEDYKLGVEDVNKALQKRPKDKFYLVNYLNAIISL